MPSRPCALRSPKKLSFAPPKGKYAIGAATPMLTPTIFFNVIISIIGALQLFTQANVMTNGGPNNATLTMVLYLYGKAFNQIRFGYASATAWILFAIIITFTLIFQYSSKRWVYYEGEANR